MEGTLRQERLWGGRGLWVPTLGVGNTRQQPTSRVGQAENWASWPLRGRRPMVCNSTCLESSFRARVAAKTVRQVPSGRPSRRPSSQPDGGGPASHVLAARKRRGQSFEPVLRSRRPAMDALPRESQSPRAGPPLSHGVQHARGGQSGLRQHVRIMKTKQPLTTGTHRRLSEDARTGACRAYSSAHSSLCPLPSLSSEHSPLESEAGAIVRRPCRQLRRRLSWSWPLSLAATASCSDRRSTCSATPAAPRSPTRSE
jgi:hypothetical protein